MIFTDGRVGMDRGLVAGDNGLVTSPEAPVPACPVGSAVQVVVERSDAAVVLGVSGEVDMLTAEELKAVVVEALDQRPAVVVIDLLGVGFIGSAGLAVLVEAQQRATEHTRLRVVAAGSVTLRPLQITGLDVALEVYPTRAAALNAD